MSEQELSFGYGVGPSAPKPSVSGPESRPSIPSVVKLPSQFPSAPPMLSFAPPVQSSKPNSSSKQNKGHNLPPVSPSAPEAEPDPPVKPKEVPMPDDPDGELPPTGNPPLSAQSSTWEEPRPFENPIILPPPTFDPPQQPRPPTQAHHFASQPVPGPRPFIVSQKSVIHSNPPMVEQQLSFSQPVSQIVLLEQPVIVQSAQPQNLQALSPASNALSPAAASNGRHPKPPPPVDRRKTVYQSAGRFGDSILDCVAADQCCISCAACWCMWPCVWAKTLSAAKLDRPWMNGAILTVLWVGFLGLFVLGNIDEPFYNWGPGHPVSALYIFSFIFLLCAVAFQAFYRYKIRHKYGISGDPVTDFCAHLVCPCCAIAQEARHVEKNTLHPEPAPTAPGVGFRVGAAYGGGDEGE